MKTIVLTARVIVIFIIALFVLRFVASAQAPMQQPDVKINGDPQGSIWRLFDTYDLVAISEMHRSKEVHEFLRSLIRDPRLTKHRVTNIVVEFGNAKYQSIADRYAMDGKASAFELQ